MVLLVINWLGINPIRPRRGMISSSVVGPAISSYYVHIHGTKPQP